MAKSQYVTAKKSPFLLLATIVTALVVLTVMRSFAIAVASYRDLRKFAIVVHSVVTACFDVALDSLLIEHFCYLLFVKFFPRPTKNIPQKYSC